MGFPVCTRPESVRRHCAKNACKGAHGCFRGAQRFELMVTTLLNMDASEAAHNARSSADEPTELKPDEAESETDETERDTDVASGTPHITEATDVTVTVPTKDLSLCLRLAQCLTYSSCQSRTLPGRLRLHEVSHMHFTKRHLNVGLSRGTSCDSIDLRK